MAGLRRYTRTPSPQMITPQIMLTIGGASVTLFNA